MLAAEGQAGNDKDERIVFPSELISFGTFGTIRANLFPLCEMRMIQSEIIIHNALFFVFLSLHRVPG